MNKGTGERKNKRLKKKSIKSSLLSPSCGCQQQSEHSTLSGKSFFKEKYALPLGAMIQQNSERLDAPSFILFKSSIPE